MFRRSVIKGILTPWLYGLLAILPYALARLMAPVVENQNPIPLDRRLKLRPPGALQPGSAFIEACLGCGLCVEVCPHPSVPIRVAQRFEGTITGHRSLS